MPSRFFAPESAASGLQRVSPFAEFFNIGKFNGIQFFGRVKFIIGDRAVIPVILFIIGQPGRILEPITVPSVDLIDGFLHIICRKRIDLRVRQVGIAAVREDLRRRVVSLICFRHGILLFSRGFFGRIHLVRMGLHRAGESRLREAERKAAEVRARLGALSPDKRIAGLLHRTALAREKLKSIAARRMESSVNALRDSRNRLETAAERRLEKDKARAALCRERLKALNPLDVLGRGYALVYSRDGRMLKTAAEAAAEEKLRIRFADGIVPVAGKEEDA